MKHSGRKIASAVFTTVLMLGATMAAQVTALDGNLNMNLTGLASFGYSALYTENADGNNLGVGGRADLKGFYYHPKFLSFRVSPYYNQSRLNSNSSSIYGSKGVNALADLFTGSKMPVSVSFEKNWDSQRQVDFPGSPTFESRGRSTGFGVTWGLFLENKPSIQLSYNINHSNYDVLGLDSTGTSNARGFTASSGYNIWGFSLGALYNNTRISQKLPNFVATDNPAQTTHQDGIQFTASRHLWDSTNWSAAVGHSHSNTDFTGAPTDQSNNTVSSTLSLFPVRKLGMNMFVNYGTNFGEFLLEGVLPSSSGANLGGTVGTAATPVRISNSSDYLFYGTKATYDFSANLVVTGAAERREQNFRGISVQTSAANIGTGYHHELAGGNFGTHYALSWFSASTSQSGLGHNTGASFARGFLGWQNSINFQYARNVNTSVLNFTSSGYGGGFGTSRSFRGLSVSLNANVSKTHTDGFGRTDSFATSYSAGMGMRNMAFSGTYSRSNGNALLTSSGLVPAPLPGPIIIPELLVFFNGKSYSLAGSWHPVRRWQLSGTYIRAIYGTSNLTAISDSRSDSYTMKTSYYFRQMTFVGGYTHVVQGIGTTFKNPAQADSFYVGVSRRFDFF
jgi:hypothetical protein